MRGTNESMPLATPKTLTEKHQVQSLGSCSQGRPPPPEVTPALLKSRWQAPSFAKTSSASASTDAGDETSVTTPRTLPRSDSSFTATSSTGASTSAMTTRGPILQQRLGDAAADARCSPGDDGHLAVQIIQRVPPLF